MAALSPDIGVPEVAPDTQAPNDYQRIDTNPAMFGGAIAQSEEKAGAGLSKVGQFYGEVSADHATNQYMSGVRDILGGTGKVDPDTGKIDTGYYGLTGEDALNQRAATEQKIDDLRKGIMGGLTTGESQLQFDQYSRRMQAINSEGMERFGNAQYQTWASKTNADAIKTNAEYSAWQPDDENVASASFDNVLKALVKQSQVDGTQSSPEYVNGLPDKAHAIVAEARMKGLLAQNSPNAKAFFDKNKTILSTSPGYTELDNRVVAQDGNRVGDLATSQAAQTRQAARPSMGPGVQTAGYDVFRAQESQGSNTDNPYQIQASTFARFKQGGEDFNNPADRDTVAKRFIDHLQDRYPGDVPRQAVAYFSGEGNVNPDFTSPTPWINGARTDANGKTVQSYVSDIQKRVGSDPVNDSSYLPSLRADAVQRVMQLTDDPRVQRVALARISQQFTAAQVAADQTRAAKKDASDAAANGYMTKILTKKGGPDIVNQIGNDPALAWEDKEKLNQAFLKYASDPDKAAQSFGDGFWGAYKQVTAAEGDPDRIGSIQPLLNRAGPDGDLTLSGVQKLNQIMKDLKSPDNAWKANMERHALDSAKRALSFEDDTGLLKIADPKGMNRFDSGFIPAFWNTYEKGLAEGKSPYQLLSQDSKDYIVGDLIKTYKRPDAEELQDRIEAGDEAVKDTNNEPIDLKSAPGIAKAFRAGRVTREQAQQAAIDGGFMKAPVDPNTPAVPVR